MSGQRVAVSPPSPRLPGKAGYGGQSYGKCLYPYRSGQVRQCGAPRMARMGVQTDRSAQDLETGQVDNLERFQFLLQQGYRQCPQSAEGVAGYWRSDINWKRFNLTPLVLRHGAFARRSRNKYETSPICHSLCVMPVAGSSSGNNGTYLISLGAPNLVTSC